MSLPAPAPDGARRFPGQSSLEQQDHWDEATTALVLSRVDRPPEVAFFTAPEECIAAALLDRLLGQEGEPRVPLVNLVDARLALGETDGWHYADLPEDGEVWRRSVRHLDEDARERYGIGFADATSVQQDAILAAVKDEQDSWHGLPAGHLWNLWLRYGCTAFYSSPHAWDEIGFPGPAYPRGYGNLGLDRRERFEVRDARPGEAAGGTA
ncbi:gluconate 2-dehydrogenase subunit 3 family protein [Sinomonas sp. ASV486]|uniref:gluconate 2-dehydrogenase subunit 3 family protein n=1 Tax=Sinomonas sp. ASV486 TaxID=3051170 RepID=UPI0027DE5DC4|nr:gluconate 2-dehydrogenase subunit 3 family protein [Sinomonas sp. ASV486]MDQ4492285.1 gluconate 2-dehydrogenase subunit 3 family protein [Sinomonas sp. ASV486]